MRILLISTDATPVPPHQYGGIERVVANVATNLAKRGHEVGLLAAPGSNLHKVECLYWKRWWGMPQSVAYGVQALVAAQGFNAALIHSFGQTKWILPWCLAGGRAVLSYGVLPQPRMEKVISLLHNKVILAGCSDYITSFGKTLVGGRWRTAYNCVDTTRYCATSTVAADAPLVFLSRLDRIKGVHLAIDIAAKSGRRLVIAGNHGGSGESGQYWLQHIKPRIDGSTVEYVGPLDDEQKKELLAQAAALLVPIQWDEPFGLVFIEALACGTPVISFARGALPEIVTTGIDGFLGETLDDLIRAVGRLDLIDRHACRRRVEERFSVKSTVDKYEELYAELLA